MPVQTATRTIDGELLINDGEGIDFNDGNNMQRIMRRIMFQDFALERFNRPGSIGSGFTLRTLGTALRTRANGIDLDITIDPGYVLDFLIDPGTPDYGTTPCFFAASEIFTIDAADPTNPRIDLFSAKVEKIEDTSIVRDFKDNVTGALTTAATNKRRTYRLTMTYTPGTPAGSPVEPSVPAGESKISTVDVAALQTAITQADVKDFREPMGGFRYPVPLGAGGDQASGTGWVFGSTLVWNASAGSDVLYIPLAPPTISSSTYDITARVGSIRMQYTLGASATVNIGRIRTDGAAGFVTGEDVSSQLTLNGTLQTDTITMTDPTWSTGLNHADADVNQSYIVMRVVADSGSDQVSNVFVNYMGIV